jgi:hypothetical protein
MYYVFRSPGTYSAAVHVHVRTDDDEMDVQERNVINFSSSIFLVVVLDAPRDDDDQADMFELALPADFMLHYRRPAAYLVVVVVHQQIKSLADSVGRRAPQWRRLTKPYFPVSQ